MSKFEEYTDLMTTGHVGAKEQIAPEDEFFHSIYISGKTRKNHINIEEVAGKIQVRGVEYNLDEVNMIITHTKELFLKEKTVQGRQSTECFSYKPGPPPWYGTTRLQDGSPRPCPQTRADRALVEFCAPCRSQIVVAGIYCKADGSPILTDEKKPIFVFIRGKGTKYKNVSEYLNDMFKLDLTPLFDPPSEQSLRFEKSVVNNKRFVTTIRKGIASTKNYGDKDVFVLAKGKELAKEVTVKILEVSKNTLEKFNEKFDWSKKASSSATSYAQEDDGSDNRGEDGILSMDLGATKEPTGDEKPEKQRNFSFDDINFE
jgi:hypothetical protein